MRAISDKADDSASMDYAEFERLAVLHSVRLTRALFRHADAIIKHLLCISNVFQTVYMLENLFLAEL